MSGNNYIDCFNMRLITFFLFILVSFGALAAERHPKVRDVEKTLLKLSKGNTEGGKYAPQMGYLELWKVVLCSSPAEEEPIIPVEQLHFLHKVTCDKIEKLWGKKMIHYKGEIRNSKLSYIQLPKPSETAKYLVVQILQGNDATTYEFFTTSDNIDKKGWKKMTALP